MQETAVVPNDNITGLPLMHKGSGGLASKLDEFSKQFFGLFKSQSGDTVSMTAYIQSRTFRDRV